MFRRLVGMVAAALLGLSVAGCSALPEPLRNEARQLDSNIDRLEETVKQREDQYTAAKRSGDWAFFGPYATREKWDSRFVTARSSIDTLRTNYDTRVQPILSKNEPTDAEALRGALRSVTTEYTTTLGQVNFVRDRMALIKNGRAQAANWRAESERNAATIAGVVTGLKPVIIRAKADFPNRNADIDKRFLPIQRMSDEVTGARAVIEAEYAKHASNSGANYAAFADAVTLVRLHTNAISQQNTSYRAQLASLSREYTLILRDMKMEYWVKPQQETWCDYTDCFENTNEFGFIAVSKAVFDSIENAEEISDGTVRSLGLNPDNDQDYSRGGRTWYIADSEIRYFHKYAEVNGKTVTERDWEVVDEEDFGRHANDFGMAIKTKRLGQFEDEVIDEAIPPGMDMVGDPRYGRWVPDGQGGQSWSFLEAYAVYALLTGNNGIYSRNDYDSYRRWREEERRGGGGYYGWYGTNRSSPVYGSAGSRTTSSAAYRNSPFSRVGGVRAVPNDIRTTGSNARTRGPGSRGK